MVAQSLAYPDLLLEEAHGSPVDAHIVDAATVDGNALVVAVEAEGSVAGTPQTVQPYNPR